MLCAGIDAGSKNIKVVLLKDGLEAARAVAPGGRDQAEAARSALAQALCKAGASEGDLSHVCATGMGRELVDFAHSTVTDITAAAIAAARFFPGAVTVIEVGAEESRAIRTDGAGRVLDSAVNDKCAAGSGSFTESMARALGVTLPEFGEMAFSSDSDIKMNAQCTVFAESEVVSLIHENTDKKDIARAVVAAIAARTGAMARKAGLAGDPVLLGGMANNPGFRKCLMENLGVSCLQIPENPEFADALGAAILAGRRALKGSG